MSIIVIGIDLAKNIFAVHGVDENGHAALVKPKVSREQLLPLIANLPPCLIGMEACSGAHHWARLFRVYGHTIKLMAPKFVTPYRMSGKRGKKREACPWGATLKMPPRCLNTRSKASVGKESLLKGMNVPPDGGQASPVHCTC